MSQTFDYSQITVIGFDADDTLWVNEPYFREAEEKFAELLQAYETKSKVFHELYKTEVKNLPHYGYGVKSFLLSMIETSIGLSGGEITANLISQILEVGHTLLGKEVHLLEGITETLDYLSPRYRLLVLTKGDLLDQERKIEASGLLPYFHHVEVLSDKKASNYQHLLEHLEVPTHNFLMVGNSVRSDILPLLEIGAAAIHIPFDITWKHEEVPDHGKDDQFLTLGSVSELREYL